MQGNLLDIGYEGVSARVSVADFPVGHIRADFELITGSLRYYVSSCAIFRTLQPGNSISISIAIAMSMSVSMLVSP